MEEIGIFIDFLNNFFDLIENELYPKKLIYFLPKRFIFILPRIILFILRSRIKLTLRTLNRDIFEYLGNIYFNEDINEEKEIIKNSLIRLILICLKKIVPITIKIILDENIKNPTIKCIY